MGGGGAPVPPQESPLRDTRDTTSLLVYRGDEGGEGIWIADSPPAHTRTYLTHGWTNRALFPMMDMYIGSEEPEPRIRSRNDKVICRIKRNWVDI